MDVVGLEFDRRTLFFKQRSSEKAFLVSRKTSLAKAFVAFAVAWFIATAAWALLQVCSGWTAQATIRDPDMAKVALCGYVVGGVGSLILGSAFALSLRSSFLSSACMESIAVCWFVTLQALLLCINGWYLALIFGKDPEEALTEGAMFDTDLSLVVVLHFMVAVSHQFDVRWALLVVTELTALCVFVVPQLLRPVGARRWGHIVILMLFLLISSIGKRASETCQRKAFTAVIVEKRLRAAAEHRLELAALHAAGAVAGTISVPTSVITEAAAVRLDSDATSSVFHAARGAPLAAADVLQGIESLAACEKWLLEPEALEVADGGIVGLGAFGFVLPGLYMGTPAVIKAPRHRLDAASSEDLTTIAQEVRVFRKLRHPNIVLFFGACVDPATAEVVIVMERIFGPTLEALCCSSVPPWSDRCNLVHGIACALRYLHGQHPCLIHGDVKGSNVLVEPSPAGARAKLIDFGLGRVLTKRALPMGGTMRWMAPEVIVNRSAPPAPERDVFSFGRLLFLVMVGRLPLEGATRKTIIMAARQRHALDLGWPEDGDLAPFKALSSRCLSLEPAERPSSAEVLRHARTWLDDAEPTKMAFSASGPGRGSARQPPAIGAPASLQSALPSASPRRLPLLQAIAAARAQFEEVAWQADGVQGYSKPAAVGAASAGDPAAAKETDGKHVRL